MKKILTLIVFALFSVSSYAQTVWKDTVEYKNFPKDGNLHGLFDTIYNNTSSVITVTWAVTSTSMLPGWTALSVCDGYAGGGTCYTWSDVFTPKSFDIQPNSKGYLDVQMKAAATASDGIVTVTVDISNYGPIVYKYQAGTVGTRDLENNNLVNIYPNPAANYVNIALNDNKISTINVVNVIGRRIAKFNVDPAKNDLIHVPLDKVSNGIYLLQFADLNGKVLGVRRVTKQ